MLLRHLVRDVCPLPVLRAVTRSEPRAGTRAAAAPGAASRIRRSEGARVYRALQAAIIDGRLRAGGRIIEEHIAAQFRVSRTPVRDAIQRLHREGYVVTPIGFRHARPIVAPLSHADAAELFALVALLESFAAAAAARLPTHIRLDLADELAAANEAFRRAGSASRSKPDQIRELDRSFHAGCTRAAGGPRLAMLLDIVKPQADRYAVQFPMLLARRVLASVAEHEAIVQAIRAGDPEAAREAVVANYERSSAQLTEGMGAAQRAPRRMAGDAAGRSARREERRTERRTRG